MRRVIALALAALLAGCATADPGIAWIVDQNPDEGMKLVLGAPDSDDVRLMMTCRARSGVVDVMVAARPKDGAVVELRSGKITRRYPGAGIADEESVGGMDIQFKADPADPVLSRFADTGELKIEFPRREIVLPNGFSQAHDFLRVCRR